MEKLFKLRMASMPNFITIEMPTVKRQDGFNNTPTIDVKDLTPEEVDAYAEEMKQAFIKHCKSRKQSINGTPTANNVSGTGF